MGLKVWNTDAALQQEIKHLLESFRMGVKLKLKRKEKTWWVKSLSGGKKYMKGGWRVELLMKRFNKGIQHLQEGLGSV